MAVEPGAFAKNVGNFVTAQASALVARQAQISQGGDTSTALPGLPVGDATSLFDCLA